MVRLFGRGGPSLRARLEAAQVGIVDAPELEEEDEPAAAAVPKPRLYPLVPPIVIGDGSWQPPEPAASRRPTAVAPEPAEPVDAESVPGFAHSAADAIGALQARIGELERERDGLGAELRRTQKLLAEEIEHSKALADPSPAPAPTGKAREVVDSLREANQRLRRELRSETDRADRAQTRISALLSRVAGLELTCQSLARAHTGQERPDVVVVDGAEMVVPWPSRT